MEAVMPLVTMEPLMPVVAMEVGRGLLEGADLKRTGRGGPLLPDIALPGREAVLVFSREIPELFAPEVLDLGLILGPPLLWLVSKLSGGRRGSVVFVRDLPAGKVTKCDMLTLLLGEVLAPGSPPRPPRPPACRRGLRGKERVSMRDMDTALPGLRILEGVADLEPDHSPRGITMVGTRSVLRR